MMLLSLLSVVHAAEVEVHGGPEAFATRDDLLVSLGFGGGGLRVGTAVAGPVGPGRLAGAFDVGLSALSTKYGEVAASVGHELELTWTLPVTGGFALGPGVSWDGRMNYFGDWDDAHGYWMGALLLGPATRVTAPLGRSTLAVTGTLGLVGGIGRPPVYRYEKQDPLNAVGYWFTGTTQGQRWTTIATCQAVRIDTAIGLPRRDDRGGRWQVGLDTRLLRTTLPEISVGLGASAWLGHVWGAP